MKFSLELTSTQVANFKSLVHIAYGSNEVPDAEYQTLHDMYKMINDIEVKEAERVAALSRLDDMASWGYIECKFCKHEARDHAKTGTSICVQESCACNKFVK